ncbi:MAG TPA: HD domain-containing protein [Sedimentibacter sp.]|jgi:HD-GYP domain-containing protein (c-di-GMP phosphodiesterase class II)|nr:HD domain-containing protein [Sedimentibacter sp.]HHZ01147.1 HD domain-containing protein [Tissierellia bacterium]HOW23852.1 HD domain-containing protein [Sedimentibacter sp.]HRC80720.1 HD domain-containing protein [Sedimentibacter sp.]
MDGLFIFKDKKYIDQVTGTSTLSLLAKKDDFEIMLYEIKADRPNSITPGDFPDLMEFYYIVEGALEINDGDNVVKLCKGDYFYVSNIKETVPVRALEDTKMLYVSSKPVYNLLYTYTGELKNLLEKSEQKDTYTHNHSNRVQNLSVKIAEKLGLSSEINYTIALASLFHDIGKFFIPNEILNKPAKLSEEEFNYIKMHSYYSYDLLKGKFTDDDIAQIVEQHHERLDGSGYPKGLKGDEIRIEARIIGVADSYDAMTSDRAYRKAMTPLEAIEELKSLAGKTYDADVVLALEQVLKDESVI